MVPSSAKLLLRFRKWWWGCKGMLVKFKYNQSNEFSIFQISYSLHHKRRTILERITLEVTLPPWFITFKGLSKLEQIWNRFFSACMQKHIVWWHREIWQSLSDENEKVPTFFLVRDLFLGWSVAQSVTGLRKKWNKFELPIRAGFCAKKLHWFIRFQKYKHC